MKNVKSMMLFVLLLFLGMGNADAQDYKSVVIKTSFNGLEYEITTIQSDYEVIVNKNKREKTFTDNDFLVLLKKELDKWFAQGYILSESIVPHYFPQPTVYIMTKKE